MSVLPDRIHIPLEIDPLDSASFVLEELLNTDFLVDPSLQFWNTSIVADVELDIVTTLDFGASVDPLQSGTFTNELVKDLLVAAGAVVDVDLQLSVLVNNASPPKLFNTITVTNPDATETLIVRFVLSGTFDETIRTGLNNFVRRDP